MHIRQCHLSDYKSPGFRRQQPWNHSLSMPLIRMIRQNKLYCKEGKEYCFCDEGVLTSPRDYLWEGRRWLVKLNIETEPAIYAAQNTVGRSLQYH